MKIKLAHKFEDIISLENLFLAWQEFLPGKRSKTDVQQFSLNLADNFVQLHRDLANFTYQHSSYQAFNISDPKPRNIHKASVRDRVLHHAIYRILYPFFDRTFISDSFSCREDRGVHKALNRFREFAGKVSRNHGRTAWVLKLDIRKFFASIDHGVLLEILGSYIPDGNIIWLLERVILSFPRRRESISWIPDQVGNDSGRKGLPLGNLTSQLFCNVYMNEFDQFVKHELKARCYLRYADDFVLLSEDRKWLENCLPKIAEFLRDRLRLKLHPKKIVLKTFSSGVDFLGWTHFINHRVLRTASRKRMLRRLADNFGEETVQSYLGLLSHGNAYKLRQKIIDWE